MNKLSVVISVQNGEKYLYECLTSVKGIADEIVVVDHDSTDKTVEIAKKFTKKIYHQKNNPESIDEQKNFGFEKATHDWILSLDADERLSEGLREEIKEILSHNQLVSGYFIPRKNIVFDKWIEHTGWFPDYVLRMFKKGKGKFTKKHVHEPMHVEGKLEKLAFPIIHENYQSIYQFLHRMLTLYAPNEATALKENGYVFSYADSIRFPFQEFLSRFFAREGYKDGFHGLVLSLLMAFYHFSVFLYLWEKEKFVDNTNALDLISDEVKKGKKEFRYWTDKIMIEKTKNPAKEILLRTKRKLGL